MGTSKNNLFTPSQNHLAALAKALGHPARIAILEVLLSRNACVCGELVDVLPLSQSTISQHLKALKEAGIITGEIEGVKTCYCINPKVWEEAQAIFGNLFKKHTCC